IHHNGEVICGSAVWPLNDKVSDSVGLKPDFSPHFIMNRENAPFRHSKTDGWCPSFPSESLPLRFRQMAAPSAVLRGHSFSQLLLPFFIQLFRRAITGVCVSRVNQF